MESTQDTDGSTWSRSQSASTRRTQARSSRQDPRQSEEWYIAKSAHQDISMLHLTVRVWICEPKENGESMHCPLSTTLSVQFTQLLFQGHVDTVTWESIRHRQQGVAPSTSRTGRCWAFVLAQSRSVRRPCQHNQTGCTAVITTDSHGETPWL